MRIDSILARKQTFSFEIFPPRGELPVEQAASIACGARSDSTAAAQFRNFSARCSGATSTGSVSAKADRAATLAPGTAASARSASSRFAALSPRFDPIEI